MSLETMEEKDFDEYLNKRVCVTLKKLKENENPFLINKLVKVSHNKESESFPTLPRYNYDDEAINSYVQVKIVGLLRSVTKNNEKVFTFNIGSEYSNMQHILLSCLPDFAMFIDTTDILHKKIEENRYAICKRLNYDVFSIINSYLTHDYKLIIK